MKKWTILLMVCLNCGGAGAIERLEGSTQIQGENLLSKEAFVLSLSSSEKRGTVVVFLSSKCPCSHSHIQELKDLAGQYKSFQFVAVHSNLDEPPAKASDYFSELRLPFPVIQDQNLKLADQFKALKTPHVFVLNGKQEFLYQGGVSSSRKWEQADRKLLREALEDITQGRAVRTPQGRTLGCAITRGEKKCLVNGFCV